MPSSGMFEEIEIEPVGALIQRPIVSKANNNGSAVLFSYGKCTFVPGDEDIAPTIYQSISAPLNYCLSNIWSILFQHRLWYNVLAYMSKTAVKTR